ncbi:hypothetical protein NMY22_g620 [Coprinellus aureogranulatus]|nr:hypothetical protein NMY22_g620 [Coprinellus aureogranulatus]
MAGSPTTTALERADAALEAGKTVEAEKLYQEVLSASSASNANTTDASIQQQQLRDQEKALVKLGEMYRDQQTRQDRDPPLSSRLPNLDSPLRSHPQSSACSLADLSVCLVGVFPRTRKDLDPTPAPHSRISIVPVERAFVRRAPADLSSIIPEAITGIILPPIPLSFPALQADVVPWYSAGLGIRCAESWDSSAFGISVDRLAARLRSSVLSQYHLLIRALVSMDPLVPSTDIPTHLGSFGLILTSGYGARNSFVSGLSIRPQRVL